MSGGSGASSPSVEGLSALIEGRRESNFKKMIYLFPDLARASDEVKIINI